ncbi:hypothetical protein NVP2117O_61 [Vibrio phage 2.117.O._10N.261.45.E9]|nr:hypothetical protein NVP1117O_61 [Vibrio phage 1.117.O._10N.261.45.E9]AUR95462.1 hypothetical protein NVP1207B_55 [Vibrio phage 1.207.B._10N.222.51.C2]AUS02353.1 hypothetical protein NVP2117O_61 [Vibrio phage 2.117.O._10N.261.45.E9]
MATTILLIDLDGLRLPKACKTTKQGAYWADILLPKKEYHLCSLEGKSFSVLSEAELRTLILNETGSEMSESMSYDKLVEKAKWCAEQLEVDATEEAVLAKKLGREITPIQPIPQPEKKGRKTNPATSGGKAPTRPKAGTATGRVWDLADSVHTKVGDDIEKQMVVDLCVAEGINPSTAGTQFGKWRKFMGI